MNMLMPCRITAFDEAFADEFISVFNRENAGFEFVVPPSPSLLKKQILSKSAFSKEGCFVLLEKDRVIGFALTCSGANNDRKAPDPEIGGIAGAFFPTEKHSHGEILIRHCVKHLKKKGVAFSMLAKIFKILGDSGIKDVLVGTTVENTAAKSTCEKAGMKIVAFRTGTRLVM